MSAWVLHIRLVFKIDSGIEQSYVSAMDNYRNLEIYNDARKLAIEIHAMSLKLPKFEMYETGSQIRRSSKSVTAMIVEGYCRRRYKADFIKFLIYSISECDETLVHLDALFDTKSLNDEKLFVHLHEQYVKLSKKNTQWVEEEFVWKPASLRANRPRYPGTRLIGKSLRLRTQNNCRFGQTLVN